MPVAVLLIHIRPRFLIVGSHWHRRLHILRPNHAARKDEQRRAGDRSRTARHCDPSFFSICGADSSIFLAISTLCPLTSESDGLSITASLAVRPEAISTLAPSSLPIFTDTSCTRPLCTTPTRSPSARNSSVFDGIIRLVACSGTLK